MQYVYFSIDKSFNCKLYYKNIHVLFAGYRTSLCVFSLFHLKPKEIQSIRCPKLGIQGVYLGNHRCNMLNKSSMLFGKRDPAFLMDMDR